MKFPAFYFPCLRIEFFIFLEKIINMKKKEEVNSLGDWISKKDAMLFLSYKETQMCEFMKKHSRQLRVSKFGRRCFITQSSILKVLENNIQF